MRDYPVGSAVFLAVLSIFALFAGFFLVLTGGGDVRLPTLVLWALLGVVSESLSVHNSRGNIYISTTEAVVFGAYITGGTVTGLVTICASLLLWVEIRDGKMRNLFTTPFRLTLFNSTHFIVGLSIVDLVYRFLVSFSGGNHGCDLSPFWTPFVSVFLHADYRRSYYSCG
ncbi:hypothetical protein [Sediminispirochaeta smaragdinae]|uniref:Uncharacterized protein n=1 Tax=Sediminispirochaeta smaragdinae (strain DSM 11293 / JCM 15392 / SEBR 4228) TaxID=573413 RepID=E1R0W4_SEDSS|nr:hypothetical protein [Sediminispirochaeta smaragdinae]ADK80213.1 hypothetical protein Spirs_1080 [Sediminispirochaeta smaragdinae DSM 11293]